ncbi:molybdopterin/thiamine biosynthesis adenylyltransferase [Isoptericola jiangsuensis]|uniref:Molybdopterin/thiamine biosynthesis adenylyltransferase n=1 Tax=Isoptericola jiangsuensis TaxID=548579 RepID=A0A2A9EV51_9MICO|nr:ThiF family adenylyltransferase [Isoptericola jiangsuensis]PFG42391.1 molybdopterin/thiamine biosynthesis adenylyltransferase [Isoptericola jiangsuensis]
MTRTRPRPPEPVLRPGMPVLDRGDGEVQLGTDPRWALVLTGLHEREVRWLCDVAAHRHGSLRRSAARHGVAADRRDDVLATLARGGLVLAPARSRPEVTAVAAGGADVPALAALLPDGDGLGTLARRAARTVAVVGLARIGSLVAAHLAAAGVGSLLLDDDLPVQVTDLGVGTYAAADVGRRRADALRGSLAALTPRTGTGATRWRDDDPPSAVVVVADRVDRPEAFARLTGLGVPHLSVVVREADVLVGPFVLPGTSACVACRHHQAGDDDPRWPELARQLRGWQGVTGQETVLATTVAAVAAGQVLSHLDGTRPGLCDAVAEVRLPDALPRLRPLDPHPACGCTAPRPVPS